jgi:hypothetical protein
MSLYSAIFSSYANMQKDELIHDLLAYAGGSMSKLNAAIVASSKGSNNILLVDIVSNIDRLSSRPAGQPFEALGSLNPAATVFEKT